MKKSSFNPNQQIFQYFKNYFVKELNQKRLVSKDDLLYLIKDEFNLKNDDPHLHYLEQWYLQVAELGFLAPIFESYKNLGFQEIILHSSNELQVFTHGSQEIKPLGLTDEDYQLALETLASQSNQNWSYTHPFCSFPIKLHGQSLRATLIHSSLTAQQKSKLFLRTKYRPETSTRPINDYLRQAMLNKKNIVISGATSSGKTTLLRSLLQTIDPEEHLLLIEDTAEIDSLGHQMTHLVADDKHPEKTLAKYCKYALRLRPDRIIMGELRGEEVVSYLLCMNTGHQGMLTTLHANNAKDALIRLATLFQLYHPRESFSVAVLMRMICQNIDIVVHMKDCQIEEIIEVRSSEGDIPYYDSIFTKAA